MIWQTYFIVMTTTHADSRPQKDGKLNVFLNIVHFQLRNLNRYLEFVCFTVQIYLKDLLHLDSLLFISDIDIHSTSTFDIKTRFLRIYYLNFYA